MSLLTEVHTLDDERLDPFHNLTERQLRNRRNPSEGLFIVESPKVIDVALRAGIRPAALLCERRHVDGDAAPIIAAMGNDVPIYTGSRELLSQLTGYTLTRGVLCAMHRPAERPLEQLASLPGTRRLAVLDSVVDNTNIGTVFRSAAALGMDGVVLTRTSCDPLNRRSVRVSMGSVFLVPWTWCDSAAQLRQYGFSTVALALTDRSIPIDHSVLKAQQRLALILGTEGTGLEQHVIDDADFTARIPMHYGVDSLNVAVAAGIAFWELRHRNGTD